MEIGTNDLKQGMKIEIDNVPYVALSCDFVKPGKGQAFCRVKLRNLTSAKVIEKTFKSTEKIQVADVLESNLRLLYVDQGEAIFMDDSSYEQMQVPLKNLGDSARWLKDDFVYKVVFYQGNIIDMEAPTFMELKVTQSMPGVRGDTASGRVMKPATLETGAEIQIPIFIEEDEMIKVDTRTGEYVSRIK